MNRVRNKRESILSVSIIKFSEYLK